MAPATVKLCVAIFKKAGEWRQWSLYLDDPEYLRIQAVGEPGSFRYDTRRQRVESDPLFLENFFLCEILRSNVRLLRETVAGVWIAQNTESSWNSQTWVIEALMALKCRGIIIVDEGYRERYQKLDEKREMLI